MLIFTDAGINAINTAKSNGFALALVKFKVTDGTTEPLTTDSKTDFESDGVVRFTGTTASGHITNKRVIDDHTFNMDIIVPPAEPLAGGSFNITKLGLYVANPDPSPPPGEEDVLLAATKFEGTFQKFAPSATNAGNSLVLTLVVGLDNATAAIQVLDTSNRDWNFYAEPSIVDLLPNANSQGDRVVRCTRSSVLYPGAGNVTYLVHSTRSGGVTEAEWIPDNHSLLFPVHALPSISQGIVGISENSPTQIHVVYESTTLDDPDTYVYNSIPPDHGGLLLSLFVPNPTEVGGELRQVTDVTQHIDLDPASTTTGREMLVFSVTKPFSAQPGVNEVFKIWASNAVLTPGSGGGGGGGVTLEATPNAVSDKIIKRDGNQSAKVNLLADGAGSAAAEDITNRSYVQQKVSDLEQDLVDHNAAADAHSGLLSVTATANKAALRDANGRFEVTSPQTAAQAANRGYVDTELSDFSNSLNAQILTLMQSTIEDYLNDELDTFLDPKFLAHNQDTTAHADLFEVDPVSATVPIRDAIGRLKAQDPNAPEDVVTLNFLNNLSSINNPFSGLAKEDPDPDTIALRDGAGRVHTNDPTDGPHAVNLDYLQQRYSVINPSINQKQGDLQFLPDSNVLGGFRIYVYTTSGTTVQLFPAQYS